MAAALINLDNKHAFRKLNVMTFFYSGQRRQVINKQLCKNNCEIVFIKIVYWPEQNWNWIVGCDIQMAGRP